MAAHLSLAACYWRQLRARRREERMLRKVTCEGCGGTFQPSRSDALYCSPACRQAAYREHKRAERERGRLDGRCSGRHLRSYQMARMRAFW
jgi:hypothetical protein